MYIEPTREESHLRIYEQFKNTFKNDFPTKYVLLHCLLMVLLNLTLIATQIVLIISESYMANLSIGLWCGIVNIVTTYTAFVLSK